jgi:hypothetical protein
MRSLQSYAPGALSAAESRLVPATDEAIVQALSGCLTLVAPTGFDKGDRKAWLAAAAMTLQGIPPTLLDWGVAHARQVVDHPSRIVPAILEKVQTAWDMRKQDLTRERDAAAARRRLPPPEITPCTPEQAAAIMDEFPQLKAETRAGLTKHLGPPRNPTRADYLAMGVDPEVLGKS